MKTKKWLIDNWYVIFVALVCSVSVYFLTVATIHDYNDAKTRKSPKEQTRTQKQKKKEIKNEDNIHRSVRRTRSVINDYVMCNDFDLFATFTLDPKKINRYDMHGTYLIMQTYLAKQRRKARQTKTDFNYIVVPEKHKGRRVPLPRPPRRPTSSPQAHKCYPK